MRVVKVCATLAPFDIARFNATARLRPCHRFVVLEVAGLAQEYRWKVDDRSRSGWAVERLFPGQELSSLSFHAIKPRLWRALDEASPDVVVIPGWTRWGLAALGWCLAKGTPTVVMADSQRCDSRQGRATVLFKRLLVAGFDAAFVAGRPQQRWMGELGMPAEVCFDGCDVVDNDLFSGPPFPASDPKRAPTLVSCLRLVAVKNVPFVLRALAHGAPEWRWKIAGDGPEARCISRLVKEWKLESRVELLGHRPYESLPMIHREGDVYVQPSIREPWGLAVNEAMASGLPVLVSNRCGCREDLVREGLNGYTFDPFSTASLIEALNKMEARKGEWREMGRASQKIVASWGLNRFAENFWRACEAALEGRWQLHGKRLVRRTLPLLIKAFSVAEAHPGAAYDQ